MSHILFVQFCVKNLFVKVQHTDKLSKSFDIVVISFPLFRILSLLNTNVVPCAMEVMVEGNWTFSGETVVAPISRLPYHFGTLLSKRTSNSSSTCRGWLVKTTPWLKCCRALPVNDMVNSNAVLAYKLPILVS